MAKGKCEKFIKEHSSGHLMCVEEQADGTVGGPLAQALVELPLRLRVEGTTLPKPRQRLGPLLLLLLLKLHVHIRVYNAEVE